MQVSDSSSRSNEYPTGMAKPLKGEEKADVSLHFYEMLDFSLFWYLVRICWMGIQSMVSLLSLTYCFLSTLGFFGQTTVELTLGEEKIILEGQSSFHLLEALLQ